MRIARAAVAGDHAGMPTFRESVTLWIAVLAAACTVEGEVDAPHIHDHAAETTLPGAGYTGSELPPGTISLTYDDGPGANTLAIARFLRDEGIQATFFVTGCHITGVVAGAPPYGNCEGEWDARGGNIETFPREHLAEIVRLGHRVANHTLNHESSLARVTDVVAELLPVQQIIDAYIPDELYLVRWAGGSWQPSTASAINGSELERLIGQIHWAVYGNDFHCLTTEMRSGVSCAGNYLSAMPASPRASGVVLLHDRVWPVDDTDETLELTRELVRELKRRGYRFVPLDAIPGVLSARRFAGLGLWTHQFSDSRGWDDHVSYYASLRLADVDGDGDDDICGRGSGGIVCAMSLASEGGTGFGPLEGWTSDFSDAQGYRDAKYGATLQFADLDDDGDADVCVRGNTGVRCALSRANEGLHQFAPQTMWTRPGDFSDAGGWGSAWSRFGSIRLADLNRDTRPDICGRSAQGIECAYNLGDRFGALKLWKSDDFGDAHGYLSAHYGQTMQLGDIDGDRRADVCVRAALGVRCARNLRGARFGASEEWTHGPFSNADGWTSPGTFRSLHVADMNGDGDVDICGRAPTGVVCAFADRDYDADGDGVAGGFGTYQYLMNEHMRDVDGWWRPHYGGTVMFGDIDGDGRGDVCTRQQFGVSCATGTVNLDDAP